MALATFPVVSGDTSSDARKKLIDQKGKSGGGDNKGGNQLPLAHAKVSWREAYTKSISRLARIYKLGRLEAGYSIQIFALTVTDTPLVVRGRFTVTNNASGQSKFYHLIH